MDKHLYLVTFNLHFGDPSERTLFHYGVWATNDAEAEALAATHWITDLADQDMTPEDVTYETETGLLNVVNEEFGE